jgi:hypothetical protein
LATHDLPAFACNNIEEKLTFRDGSPRQS